MKKHGLMSFLLCLGIVILSGCALMMRGYGTFALDQMTEKNFESFQLDSDMNYYFSGSDVYPSVIMGLKKQYVLDNDLWRPLPSDPKLFKSLITDMQQRARDSGQLQRGFVMKSPDGQMLGICYCTFKVRMTVKMGEGNKVIVNTPDINNYPYDETNESKD